jgi:hypothetical protein
MRRIGIVGLTVLVALVFVCGSAFAGKDLVQTVAEGCEKELKTYCKNVTVGEGRVLACLYAYSDKLSGRCEYALYDAAVQLERAVNALSYVARLLDCLKKNDAKVSKRCKEARKDVGLD